MGSVVRIDLSEIPDAKSREKIETAIEALDDLWYNVVLFTETYFKDDMFTKFTSQLEKLKNTEYAHKTENQIILNALDDMIDNLEGGKSDMFTSSLIEHLDAFIADAGKLKEFMMKGKQ